MKVFTSHLKPGRTPVLVREGFSLWAALFGWLWLVFNQAWVPAALAFAVWLLMARLHLSSAALGVAVAMFLIQGMFARDWVRWSLARAGYVQGPPVLGANRDAAMARLLTERGELTQGLSLAAI